MRYIFLISFILLVSGCLSYELSREEYCEKAWRWDLECALNFTLSDQEITKVRFLAESLRGKDCFESSWNVLKWTEKNIDYDYEKAQLPSPTIITRGREVIVQNPERAYQTPLETVELRRGICGDYAILIAALLTDLGCKPYLVRLEFEGEEAGHLAAAILMDQYYILDQKLPPMDFGSYYKKWLREGKRIEMGYIYENGTLVEKISSAEMLKFDYRFSDSDLRLLEENLKEILKQRLREDEGIPHGYWEYSTLRITFQNYAELYTPAFLEEIAGEIAEEILEELEKSGEEWKAFKLELKQSSSNIIAELQLAR
jgi:predicted transglutaminase-like protease